MRREFAMSALSSFRRPRAALLAIGLALATLAGAPAPAPAAEPRKQFVKSCADILERAQLGDLSSADREVLQHECRPGRR